MLCKLSSIHAHCEHVIMCGERYNISSTPIEIRLWQAGIRICTIEESFSVGEGMMVVRIERFERRGVNS